MANSFSTQVSYKVKSDGTLQAKGVRVSETRVSPISSNYRASSLFTIIFFFMLLVLVYKALSGSTTSFSFTSILNSLDKAPTIDMSFMRTFSQSSSAYSIPLIGPFLQTLTGIVSVSVWIVLGIIQVILYIGWIVGFLFV